MRSNGLTASAYTPVADLDPRVAEALLAELKDRGVAAYTKPVESTSMSGFDRPEFVTGAQDRLYVDAAESERVKALISTDNPDAVVNSEDLTWAQIVAGFDQPIRGDVHPWPVTEDLDGPSDVGDDGIVLLEESDTETDTGPSTGSADDSRGELRRWLSRRDATAGEDSDPDALDGTTSEGTDDPDDGFVPDPPPPLPQLEPWQQLAWVGVVGGPLLLLVAVLFSISLPTWVSLLAVTGFIGGFITLVARMDDGGSDDDPDNGAVV
jgi:hypothetical protein